MSYRGSHSDTKPGQKPSVALVSEEVAKANIRSKLEILENAILNAQADDSNSLPAGYPTSRTKFNEWIPTSTRHLYLTKNANATLKRYPDLLQSVDAAVVLVKSIQSSLRASKVPDRQARIASARRAQKIHWTLRTIAERSLVVSRREASNLKSNLAVLKASKESAEREYDRIISELKDEIETLKYANAALTKQLSVVIPFGRRK